MYKKAITFSFDDGVESDKKLIQLLNKYGLKCSFNINAGKINDSVYWTYNDKFDVYSMTPFEPSVYDGHEICVHGYFHKAAADLKGNELRFEFAQDKKELEEIFKTEVVGGAYAFGCFDDKTVKVLDEIGIKHCRTVIASYGFSKQEDMLRFNPTCHIYDEKLPELIREFLEAESEEPQILYVWGHSYEPDGDDKWEFVEEIFQSLAGRNDVLYGTNTEVFREFGWI